MEKFIPHASEEKDQVARPLAAALDELGTSAGLDEAKLRIGDSLHQIIGSTDGAVGRVKVRTPPGP